MFLSSKLAKFLEIGGGKVFLLARILGINRHLLLLISQRVPCIELSGENTKRSDDVHSAIGWLCDKSPQLIKDLGPETFI